MGVMGWRGRVRLGVALLPSPTTPAILTLATVSDTTMNRTIHASKYCVDSSLGMSSMVMGISNQEWQTRKKQVVCTKNLGYAHFIIFQI